MAFEFGMFHEFQRRAGQTEAEAFSQSFAQIDAAERWGLDAVWLAEIHMAPERSVLSAPLNIASAIAARTRNMPSPRARATSRSASRFRCSRCASRCGLPRKLRPQTTSVRVD